MDLPQIRTEAYNATNQTADMQASAPGLLSQLKQNLVGIFAKDNPVIDARNNALSDYLSENSKTRASLLPANSGDVPGINGRPMTYSPTQQDAITTSRNSAALAPLAGYNEILKGMYGTIADLVGNAGNIYDSTIRSSATRAQGLMDYYKQASQEDQFNRDLAARKSAAGSGTGFDLAALISAMQGGLGTAPERLPLDHPSLQDPDKKKAAKPQPKVNLNTNSLNGLNIGNQLTQPTNNNSNAPWLGDSIMNWFKGLGGGLPKPKSLQELGF